MQLTFLLDDLLQVGLDAIFIKNSTSLQQALVGTNSKLNDLKHINQMVFCEISDNEAIKIIDMFGQSSFDLIKKIFHNFRSKSLANVIPILIGDSIYCFEIFVLKVPATKVPRGHQWCVDMGRACDSYGFLHIVVPGNRAPRSSGQCPNGAIH